ncbi:hypothetical protein IEQ34_024417 [Dendrobium chrysotoxum]|uniref:Uncharacterized protein n=1 Tax=Dendrobium chrysotoxum TaxID=161865 RepID=A0AAV7FTS4_DENCH|nr:hypothetical protein IEQ34_024417 [Dendrobium chrysotoxum]
MNVLSKLKTDGTFHQRAPLERLHGKRILYSYDLKAATDTLPAVLSGSMLVGLLGDDFGRTWLHMMTATGFRTPDRIRGRKRSNLRGRFDRFTKGQPLGLRGASYRVSSGYQRPGDGNDTGCCSIRLVAYGRILSSCGRGSRLL